MYSEILTDDTLRELVDHGTRDFPFQRFRKWIGSRNEQHEYISWHWHKEIEFFRVESGNTECRIGEDCITLHPGDGIFINSKIIHRSEAQESCVYSGIIFLPELIASDQSAVYQKYLQPMLTHGPSYLLLRRQDVRVQRILDCLCRVYEEASSCSDIHELRLQILLSTLWLELISNTDLRTEMAHNNKDMLTQARLRQMMQYIWEHYSERISLLEIANAANISKSAALRCFRAGVQTSPVEYLNDYRLDRAKEMLLSTQNTVSDIALSVGFDSAGYFDRMFKRTFGLTPKQYRKQSILSTISS